MSKILYIIKEIEEERMVAFQKVVDVNVNIDVVFADPNDALDHALATAAVRMREWEEDDEVGRFTLADITESYDKSAHGDIGFVIMDDGAPSERWVITPVTLYEEQS